MRLLAGFGVLAIAVAIADPGMANGAGDSGEAYAARVEPICRATTPAIESLLHGTRQMANHGRPVAAGRRFVHASNIFAATVRRVERVKRPTSLAARLGKWVERLGNVKEGLRRVGLA